MRCLSTAVILTGSAGFMVVGAGRFGRVLGRGGHCCALAHVGFECDG